MALGSNTGRALDAVNEILESVGEFPISTLSGLASSGVTIAERAMKFLERANTRIQAMGWPENTAYAVSKTSANMTAASLAAQAAGADSHRTIVIRDNGGAPELYDVNTGAVLSGSAIIDLVTEIDFDNCSISLQDLITKTAKQDFQRRIQGNPQADQAIAQEMMMADRKTIRHNPQKMNRMFPNTSGIFGAAPQQDEERG
jgi:hypothetical protein